MNRRGVIFLLLGSSALAKEKEMVIRSSEIIRMCKDKWNVHPHLNDLTYNAVSLDDIKKAHNIAWHPWIAEKWDCDDQSVALLYHLRLSRISNRSKPYPPAAGRLGCTFRGGRHSVVWFISPDGKVNLFDPSTGMDISLKQISSVASILDK